MNLNRVTENLIRSDQPNAGAWPIFNRLGVEAVLCLRENSCSPFGYHIDCERKEVDAAGLAFASIPMPSLPFECPTLEQVNEALGRISDGRSWLVHCQRGADRTGLVIACYRMSRQGWTTDQAEAEAFALGMSRLQFRIRDFLEHFEVKHGTL